jgi:hypothetical protein
MALMANMRSVRLRRTRARLLWFWIPAAALCWLAPIELAPVWGLLASFLSFAFLDERDQGS